MKKNDILVNKQGEEICFCFMHGKEQFYGCSLKAKNDIIQEVKCFNLNEWSLKND